MAEPEPNNPLKTLINTCISLSMFIFLFLPLHCFRLLFKFVSKLNPKILRFCDIRSTVWTASAHNAPAYGTVLIEIFLEGKPNFPLLKKLLQDKIQENPELSCRIGTFGGFPCLMRVDDFSVEEHFILEPENSSLSELKSRLIAQPFPNDRSPWSLHVLALGEDETVLLLRIHHCLGDGYSILKLIDKNAADCRHYIPLSPWRNFVLYTKSILNLFPPELPSPITEMNLEFEKVYPVSGKERLPLDLLKKVKKQYNTRFIAITLAAFAAAIRKHYLKKAWDLPEAFSLIMPTPGTDKGGDRMGNIMSSIFLSVPLMFVDLPDLLTKVNESLNEELHKTLCNYAKTAVFNGMPPSYFKKIGPLPVFSAASDFPGPKTDLYLGGQKCRDMGFYLNFCSSKTALVIGALSYNGSWKPSVTVGQSFCETEKEAQELIDSVTGYIKAFSIRETKLDVQTQL